MPSRIKALLIWTDAAILLVGIAFAYLLATSPYARDTMVRPAYTTTTVLGGKISLRTNYTPHFYGGRLANFVGIYLRGALDMIWNRIESPKMPPGSAAFIIAGIHALRFDPTKPYLISGDQFNALYPRNLAIFYQDLLNPRTALSPTDWTNRQRIALQSLAYCLASLQQLHRPVTTLMPISPRGVLAVNIYDYPSDTMFSVFSLLTQLESDPATRDAALQLQEKSLAGLAISYQNYLSTVRDPASGLVRNSVSLSSARDATRRQSSFYDNVMLWKTQALATQLGLDHVSGADLEALRAKIIARYWDNSEGHFIDDAASGREHSYSSDWLIALPLGFLDPSDPSDLGKLERISAYIDRHHLTDPLPIRYSTTRDAKENFWPKYFVGAYGNTAIWSYWGNQYIALETDLYAQTHQPIYATHVQTSLDKWAAVIVRDRGYPETLNAQGKMLEPPVYESIRRNGWVVGYESVKYYWDQARAAASQ